RIYKTVKSIGRLNRHQPVIQNIRILRLNAWTAFERLFTEKSLQHIYSLFPCPWPKKSHIKHRLFSRDFLNLLNNRLVDGGNIQIVTDYFPYFEWIKEENDPTLFHLEEDGIKPRFGTKFERKWLEEGQEEFFELNLLKNEHIRCKVKEDVELKSFKLLNFDPNNFTFSDVKGDVSIVLKDRIYDQEKQHLVLRFIVSEQHLIQNFWAMVRKHKDFWRLCKMEGQNFFPTPGINQTLEAIYSSATNTRTKDNIS
nr:hypothetical protein [Candidatus Omnitrophota bacterium]